MYVPVHAASNHRVRIFDSHAEFTWHDRWGVMEPTEKDAGKRSTGDRELLGTRAVHSPLGQSCGTAHIASAFSLLKNFK